MLLVAAKKNLRKFYFRICKPRSYWHNRQFHPSLHIIHERPEVYEFLWEGKIIAQATAASAMKEQHSICNIIGSGPSINAIKKPKLLFNNKTMCVNGSYIIAREVGCNPDYYMISDRGFIRRKFDLFKSAALGSKAVVLDASGINAVCGIDPFLLQSINIIYLEDYKHPYMRCSLHRATHRQRKEFEGAMINHRDYDLAFSKDLTLGIFQSGTVIYNAVQFSYGIGFKELYIFGMDLSATGRFYPEEVPETSSLCESYESKIKPAFELVRQYVTEEYLAIFNCSLQSRLPDTIINKIDPDTALELTSKSVPPSLRHVGRRMSM